MLALLLMLISIQDQAKVAFDNIQIKNSDSFEDIYAKCIKEKQVIVLVINAPPLENLPWKIIQLKQLSGEKSGYIVGVPKDGKLIRLDFSPTTTRQRIRLDVLHVYYPLTAGYVECPTCPYGRIKR